jgi:hypothetical protein
MQLAAYGAQDAYLTTKPEVTFFKAVYRRHTNFAMESMEQTLQGTAAFGASSLTCKVSRNGDALGPVYFKATLPAITSDSDTYCGRVGFRLLKSVDFRVGGQSIDKHYSNWMHVWTELTHSYDQKRLLDQLVGATDTDLVRDQLTDETGAARTVNVPLLFSFCRNPGLALPLIALQYHEVELRFELSTLAECVNGADSATGSLSNATLWCDYYFFDAEERKEFAANPHEYLIETVQREVHNVSTGTNTLRLTFNHPTKMIVWSGRRSAATDPLTDFTHTDGTGLLTLGKLKLNGTDRFSQRDATYFNYVQPYQHTGCYPDVGINMYSFALKPHEHQPSGSCNFSRIDNINLEVTSQADGEVEVNALSYNVFRCASGMGGNAYAN